MPLAQRRRFALLTITNGATACLMLADLSLLSVEAIGPLHALILAGAILYGRWPGKPRTPHLLWDSLALAALILFPFDLFLFSRNLIGAALRLLTFVVIYRCSNLSGHRELRQAVSLSFVQILAAAASTTEVYFALLLAAYLWMAIWTLMAMASARDEAPPAARRTPAGRPVLAMTGLTLALGTILFFAIPHFGTGYFQRASLGRAAGSGLTGFADRIELGSIGRIKKNRALVMKVRPHPLVTSAAGLGDPGLMPVRWRGVALDTFDGRSWSVARPDTRWLPLQRDGSFQVGLEGPQGQPLLDQEIIMEPSLVPVLFASPGPFRIYSDDLQTVGVDAGGTIHLPVPRPRRFTYRVVSPDPEKAMAGYGSLPPEQGSLPLGHGSLLIEPSSVEMTRYLTLPRVDPQVEALARQLTAGAMSPFEKARLIEDHLRSNYPYSLEVNDAGVADPVAHFLLQRKSGHCEYFATAMAVMLRHLGMPSRVVNGFSSGEWSDLTESFLVRQSDAHSWVEAWMPERGWVTFDPTPSDPEIVSPAGLLAKIGRSLNRIEILWDTWIIGLDMMDQGVLASTLVDAVAGAAATAWRALAGVSLTARGLRVAGWAGVAMLLLVLTLAARAAACGGRTLPRLRWRLRWLLLAPRRTGPLPAPGTDLLRRFEARWAARGLLRAPGQTPLEFAREIERRALDTPGAAMGIIYTYYQARYGA